MMTRKRLLLIGWSLVACVCMPLCLLLAWLCVGLSMFIAGSNEADAEIKDRVDIQRQARITIPLSAKNIRCATDAGGGGRDVATYGRFDIPASDLPLVLAKMPSDEKVSLYDGYSNVTSHNKDVSWWQPEMLLRKQVADWAAPGYSVNLLFGYAGEEETVTVYFYNFSL